MRRGAEKSISNHDETRFEPKLDSVARIGNFSGLTPGKRQLIILLPDPYFTGPQLNLTVNSGSWIQLTGEHASMLIAQKPLVKTRKHIAGKCAGHSRAGYDHQPVFRRPARRLA